jgi:hypothetical protein
MKEISIAVLDSENLLINLSMLRKVLVLINNIAATVISKINGIPINIQRLIPHKKSSLDRAPANNKNIRT